MVGGHDRYGIGEGVITSIPFSDCSIRKYWDNELKIWVDRDINAAINLKRLGLDVFPSIKRCRGNPVVLSSTTNSTAQEVLTVLFKASEAHAVR